MAEAILVVQEKDGKLVDKDKELAELKAQLAALQASHDEKHEDLELHRAELERIKSVDPVTLTDHVGNPIAVYYPVAEAARESKLTKNEVVIPDLSINNSSLENPTNAGFGTEFPKDPVKGDTFLRVDYLPGKLYKWNEKKWIEISRATSDSYAYDEEYIKHLLEKINSGEYDVELLTPAEVEQIERYQNGNSNKQ